MGIKKAISLRRMFTRFLAMLILLLITGVIIPFSLFYICVNSGIAHLANNSEAMAVEAAGRLAVAPELSLEAIPNNSAYLVLDKSLNVLDTNMDDETLDAAMAYAKGKAQNYGSSRFLLVTRDNEYVILQYHIVSTYANPSLNKWLPSPDVLLIVFIIVNSLLACIISTSIFSRRMGTQLKPLHEAAEQIGNRQLDFSVGRSGVREVNAVLDTFDDMKKSLKESLEEQWKMEQVQREQIAALAHDLRTPLTVVIGNADLLDETELTPEQEKYIKPLLKNATSMEHAVSMLIDISRAKQGFKLNIQKADMSAFVADIQAKAVSLAELKKINLTLSVADVLPSANIDTVLLGRAIMNIISNAVDFTPEGGKIDFTVEQANERLVFTVQDSGPGFSTEALSKATQHLYMGDSSRSGREHFGMGLAIADSIVGQHSGSLEFCNSAETGGAIVKISFPHE